MYIFTLLLKFSMFYLKQLLYVVFFIKAIEEDGTQQNCDVIGTHFLSEMLKLREEFEVVGDVRGKGLMLGFELVADKVSAVDTEYELNRSATYPPPPLGFELVGDKVSTVDTEYELNGSATYPPPSSRSALN